MPGNTTEQAIELMVQRLVERFDPDQTILFGSQARGTAGPGSDVDLLVIMPVTGSKRARQLELRMTLHDIAVPKDIILAPPDEIARRRDIVGTIIRPALREGKLLYARPGWGRSSGIYRKGEREGSLNFHSI
jgi:predicted nucleotidyltransferase